MYDSHSSQSCYVSGPLCTGTKLPQQIEQKVVKMKRRRNSEIDVARGTPERLKLGGSGQNPQLIYFLESVHRPCHVSLKSQ